MGSSKPFYLVEGNHIYLHLQACLVNLGPPMMYSVSVPAHWEYVCVVPTYLIYAINSAVCLCISRPKVDVVCQTDLEKKKPKSRLPCPSIWLHQADCKQNQAFPLLLLGFGVDCLFNSFYAVWRSMVPFPWSHGLIPDWSPATNRAIRVQSWNWVQYTRRYSKYCIQPGG